MKKHSLVLMGHKTSVALEPVFWDALSDLAQEQGLSIAALAAQIDSKRAPDESLAGAIRVYIVKALLQKIKQSV